MVKPRKSKMVIVLYFLTIELSCVFSCLKYQKCLPFYPRIQYYFRESDSYEYIYTGIELNGINEWDLDKAGWFKWRSSYHYYSDAEEERQHLTDR